MKDQDIIQLIEHRTNHLFGFFLGIITMILVPIVEMEGWMKWTMLIAGILMIVASIIADVKYGTLKEKVK